MRLCTVKDKKAIFHRWEQVSKVIPPSPMLGGHPGGQISYMLAVVEREDGSITCVIPSDVKFQDTRATMKRLEAEVDEAAFSETGGTSE